ncbi:MAG TPA: ParB/RepB/Spo0J family partition protein [Candidatus Limnocylindrales bacterium]|nr:ParB/RepB/Spo0J family partition protein [Candidatus Limnocylindrales bacterium]
MARPDFRTTAAKRLSEERELSPSIISLISPEGSDRPTGVRMVPLDRIQPDPHQPRMHFDEEALNDLAASIREHGVLQPVLVRPAKDQPHHYQLVAGERRWRASRMAQLEEVPAIIEQLDDDTALEIGLIENLQREDLSPLEEALMYERMVSEHGYSVRKLAQKIGKDKGYVENRLRLADAPTEIKQLVSLRKDTISHAYELLKVDDPRKRRKLAERVATGELSLVKLRERIEGRRRVDGADADGADESPEAPVDALTGDEQAAIPSGEPVVLREDSLVSAKQSLSEALDELAAVLGSRDALGEIGSVDRANLAKYLTIAKMRLENAIAVIRAGEGR